MTKKVRIRWIDIARGIGILLVVYGHALSAGELRAVIYSFHMPLFFLLSGLVFRYKSDESLHAFIRKNARNIMLPYFMFALMSFLLWCVVNKPAFIYALFQFGSIFYGNGNDNLLRFNNILWFLPCLFIVRLMFFGITRRKHTAKALLIILFVVSVVGYGYSFFFGSLKLPFGFETALTALPFFGVGYLLTGIPDDIGKKIKKLSILLLPILSAFCLIFALMNFHQYGVQIDLRKDVLNNYLYFILAAFSGIFVILMISMLIRQNKGLEYLGRQSLVIFAWHLLAFPYVSYIVGFLGIRAFLSDVPSFIPPMVWSILAILLVLIIAVPVQKALLFLRTKKHLLDNS